MPDIKMPLEYRVDVRAPLTIQPLVTLLMEGDAQANELRVSLFDGKTPLELSGLSVGGSFTRADGAEVPIKGSVESNVVKAALDEYCYAVPGPFGLYVQLLDSLGDVKRTVLLMAGYVHERGHGPVIDTGIALPSLDDILAQLETMKNVTNAANQAASGANAAAGNADAAAGRANEAAGTANAAATNADAAAGRANEAAGKWNESSAEKLSQRIDNLVGSDEETVKNADLLDGKPPSAYTAAELLVNSDWRIKKNIINQRGLESYSVAGCTIDRWETSSKDLNIALLDGGLKITNTGSSEQTFYQFLETVDYSKPYTLAVCDTAGNLYVGSAFFPTESGYANYAFNAGTFTAALIFSANPAVRFKFMPGSSHTFEWASLCKGVYTAKTFPTPVQLDYVLELQKCQTTFYQIDAYSPVGFGYSAGSTDARVAIALPVNMRVIPSIQEGATLTLVGGGLSKIVTDITVASMSNNIVRLNIKTDGLNINDVYTAYTQATPLQLIADIK